MKKITIAKGSRVEFHSKELLFLAKSGQPYRGSLSVKFESLGESFDMLDFKRYLTSLRSEVFYAEDIAFEIYTKIQNAIEAKNLGVIVDLSARGGIAQRVSFGDPFEVTQKNNIFQVE